MTSGPPEDSAPNPRSQPRSGETRAVLSRDDILHHRPRHIRKPEIAAAVPERQPRMIQPHQVQDGRMQIVNVYWLVDRLEPEIIRRAIRRAAPHSAPGEQIAVPVVIVVAPV